MAMQVLKWDLADFSFMLWFVFPVQPQSNKSLFAPLLPPCKAAMAACRLIHSWGDFCREVRLEPEGQMSMMVRDNKWLRKSYRLASVANCNVRSQLQIHYNPQEKHLASNFADSTGKQGRKGQNRGQLKRFSVAVIPWLGQSWIFLCRAEKRAGVVKFTGHTSLKKLPELKGGWGQRWHRGQCVGLGGLLFSTSMTLPVPLKETSLSINMTKIEAREIKQEAREEVTSNSMSWGKNRGWV